jgi:hypothetical protein
VVAEALEHPVEVALAEAIALRVGEARPAAVLVADERKVETDRAPRSGVGIGPGPQHEAPPRVEVAVEAELLVEGPEGNVVVAPEGKPRLVDGVGVRAGGVLEPAQVGRDEAEAAGDGDRWVGEGGRQRRQGVADRLGGGFGEDDDLARARRSPTLRAAAWPRRSLVQTTSGSAPAISARSG